MPTHIVFLFLFQAGLAFAFSFFITRLLVHGSKRNSSSGLLRIIRRIRIGFCVAAIILPPAMFFAYFKSLPEGQPTSIALWPAAWIFLILAAVPTALWLASRNA
jgi:hypothetical protein